MARVLGIDVGTKTLGLAVSDENARVAMPLEVLARSGLERDLRRLSEQIQQREIAEVVVGMPLQLDGRPGELAPEAELIAAKLRERCTVSVFLWDERMTTAGAERVLIQADVSRRKRRQVIDKLAATLILQGFLDRRSLEQDRSS
ncbi:MAG: Holliday junction resolvase RuvX [Acidobacteriota bacterium]|nr:MAG: Holliday junction resolvase RuvX [Acidobacteriota bacterium]